MGGACSSKYILSFCSVATWSSPETTGPRPPPCAAFSFTKVDLSRAVMFGGRQRHKRVNEVHILDMDNWVNRNVICIIRFLSLPSVSFPSTGVELSCLPVHLVFGRKRDHHTVLVLCLPLHHPLPQKVLPMKPLTHHLLTQVLANTSHSCLYCGECPTTMNTQLQMHGF